MSNDKKEKAKKLKMLGSAILLFAFATQQFLVAKYIGKVEDHFKSYQSYNSAYNSSLLYENLYFSQASATGSADGNVLKKAAFDNVAGFSVKIASSELPKQEKQKNITELFAAANRVRDLETYNEYKGVLNTVEGKYNNDTTGDYANLNTLKETLSWAYLAMYLIGSILLIRAVKYE